MNYSTLIDEISFTWLRQVCQPISTLHFALERIASRIFQIIPRRQIYNCEDLPAAFQLLEKWKILSAQRLNVVIELSELLNGPVEMIKSRIEMVNPGYATPSFCTCYVSTESTPVQKTVNGNCTSRYAEVYDFLSENISNRRWIDLGKCLPGMRRRTEELQFDPNFRQKEKIIMILEEFESVCETNVLQILLIALKKCELNLQCDIIKNKFAHLL